MANLKGTGIIKNITPIGGGKYRISFVEDTFTGINIPNSQNIVYQTFTDSLVLMDPYINTPNFTYSDFNAVINNALVPRQSEIFWDLDYSTNAIQAVNQQAIITASQQGGDLPKAFIQDYNYQSTPILRRNYLGAKSTSPDFNELSIEGGFGQLPVVQSEGYYFAFFNWVGGTSPEWGNEIEDRSAVNVRYYIGEDGNVIEPINDSNGINLSIVQQNFEQDSNAILSFNDKDGATSQFSNLEGKHKIFKSGQIPQPIAYSQTASISDTEPGGFIPILSFIQGDQQEGATNDFRLIAYANSAILQNVGTLSLNNQYLGTQGTFVANVYGTSLAASTTTLPTTLTFEAYIEDAIGSLNGSDATFFIQKNTNGAGWVNVSQNGQVITPGVTNAVSLTYSDQNSLTTDEYRVQVTDTTNGGQGQFVNVSTNSYFKVTQTPPPGIGSVGPSAVAPNTPLDYWQLVGSVNQTKIIKPNALLDVYGQRQENVSGSGFNPITFDFNVQVGDEIRFLGTETQTYTVVEVKNNQSPPHIVFDRNVNLTNTQMNWFLHRRYVTDPSYLILEVDKPSGGTSTGVLTPEYFYGETEEKVDSILQLLTRDNLI
jgi:hypothetical protein